MYINTHSNNSSAKCTAVPVPQKGLALLSYSTVDKFKIANLTLGTMPPKLATSKAIPLSYNKACIDVI